MLILSKNSDSPTTTPTHRARRATKRLFEPKTSLIVGLSLLAPACLNSQGMEPEMDGNASTDGMGGDTQPNSGGSSTGTGGEKANTGGTDGGGTGGDSTAMGGFSGSFGNETPSIECQADFPTANTDGADHKVTVTPDSWGELPHFWNTFGTGHLGLYLREDRNWGETLQAHTAEGVEKLGMDRIRSHGIFHDDIGIYSEEEDGTPVYSWENADQIMDFLVDLDIDPIVELAPMPADMAADPSETVFDWEMIISPPKDYALWQELVRQFVQHYIDKYGTEEVSTWDFEVWNEPECCNNKFWAGTLEEYYQLYDAAAAGVREALPNGRVGGPVVSQPLELENNSEAGVKFLDHITSTDGTLDFFTYHSWSFVGGAVDGYFQGIDLLESYGFTEMPIAITEFGPTWEFGLYDEPQEMDQGAAFVAQTFSDISQRCAQDGTRFPMTYSWWVLSDIFEEGMYREDDPFIGCMGLITRENIHKPAYNAYRFLAQMGTEQVELSVEGSGSVGGMAARDADGGVQILIYNGQNPGNGPTDDTYYEVTDEQEISLTLAGIDPETAYDVTAYRVDKTRGNAYAVWQSQGRPSMSEMSEDDWQALRDSMDSPAEPIGQALCGDTFSETFQLPSPGVLFVTLVPTEE